MSLTDRLLPPEPNPLIGFDSRSPGRSKTLYRSISIPLWPAPIRIESRGNSNNHRSRMRAFSPTLRKHLVVTLGEFLGTFSFLFFSFQGTNVVNTAPAQGQPTDLAADPARLLFICLCFGMSLAVNAAAFAPISGAMFNPAVTLGLMCIRQLGLVQAALVVPAQLLAAVAAAAVAKALAPGPLVVTTVLAEGTSVVQGLFIEMLLTTMLVFTIFMLAVEHPDGSGVLAPIGIGLALFLAQLAGVYRTGGSLNPARSFGPAVVTASFDDSHWIYWVGPGLGAVLAAAVYGLLKLLKFETVSGAGHQSQPVGEPGAKESQGSQASDPASQAV